MTAAQHDDSSSSSTYCSGFALQSSIDCSRMVNQSESSCQIRFICYKVGPWSKYSFVKFVKQSFKNAVVRVTNSRQTVVSWWNTPVSISPRNDCSATVSESGDCVFKRLFIVRQLGVWLNTFDECSLGGRMYVVVDFPFLSNQLTTIDDCRANPQQSVDELDEWLCWSYKRGLQSRSIIEVISKANMDIDMEANNRLWEINNPHIIAHTLIGISSFFVLFSWLGEVAAVTVLSKAAGDHWVE